MPEQLEIHVAWSLRSRASCATFLARVGRAGAIAEGFAKGSLSIAVVGDRKMSLLHEQFSQVRGPTDVLTFDLGTSRRTKTLDGEIVVCYDVARRATERNGRKRGLDSAIRSELALYVTHGILHLSGHDDRTPAEFQQMHKRESELLRRLGVRHVAVAPGSDASAATSNPAGRRQPPDSRR